MARYPFTCALVTGASSGIGHEIAVQLGMSGVSLVVVARRGDRLEELAARFKNVEVLVADLLTDAGLSSVEARISDTTKTPIDLVVNNAGFGTSGLVQDLDVDRLTNEIRLNVVALTRLSHAAITAMIPRGRGYLLNVSSVASFQAGPRLAVYSATKAYVTSFTEALHEELRGTGVRVTALCPGLTRTEFQSVSNTEGFATQYPNFAWLNPTEVARDGLNAVTHGKALSIPGAIYKGLSAVSGITPRGLARRIASLTIRRH
ncbi:MAG: SDR family oxidoreductase [Acidimicrobiaceae bacterium]|nr:SDR family oxidoreductase [Acidimicrobiaceae bacterium]